METDLKTIIGAVFACIGGLYTLARVIVAMTPTPKDDKYLDKVSGYVVAIAKAIGLDLKQGRNT